MGSSSKKYKEKSRESRKRKHRSRSKSPETSDRHRRRHKRRSEKDNRADSSSEDGTTPAPPPPKLSKESSPPPPPTLSQGASGSGGQGSESLSIEETNKLRIKLGLKPLKVEGGESSGQDAQPKKTSEELMGGKDMGEFVHRAPENWGAKKKAENLRAKLKDKRDKRAIEQKLKQVKTLGDESSDDDTYNWVNKSRKIEEERAQAAKRAKVLEEMDAEFGVGELVRDDFHSQKNQAYTSRDLRGLRIEHDVDEFKEGRNVVLTLKDKGVLDEEEDDVLVNVNIIDDEKYRKNTERKKKKPGYNAYDDEKIDDFGNVQKSLLGKYDEEITGEERRSFTIGGEAHELERRAHEKRLIQAKLSKKTLDSLVLPELQLASDYYTPEELATFKKPKKKIRKIRKKVLKASDLLSSAAEAGPSSSDLGRRRRDEAANRSGFKEVSASGSGEQVESQPLKEEPVDMDLDSEEDRRLDLSDIDYVPPTVDLSDVRLDPDEGELELQLALNKARKLRQMNETKVKAKIENLVSRVAGIKQEQDDEEGGGHIMLNSTAEFCRTLGDIPTYGLAGNREENIDELMDMDDEQTEERPTEEERDHRGTWNEVEVEDAPVDILALEQPILEEEPDVGSGVAGALRLAVSKGYLEKETSNRPSASNMNHLRAQNYSIEDKSHADDDKHSRRERFNGPTSDFKEKDSYKPNINLDYIDDDGRILSSKEAFRYLSHKFHGKGPGKNKVEKRMKKMEQEALMKQMSSTDTPLGTVTMLQQKQKETHCPYVVLSGSKQLTSISKTKM